MIWPFTLTSRRRRTVATLKLDLRRVRWIEPISGSGDWWPLPLRRGG
jgi:hypothetical protein